MVANKTHHIESHYLNLFDFRLIIKTMIAKKIQLIVNTLQKFPLQFPLLKLQLTQRVKCHFPLQSSLKLSLHYSNFCKQNNTHFQSLAKIFFAFRLQNTLNKIRL